jgi:hypothetical protein
MSGWRKQLVDGVHRRRLGCGGGRGCQLWLERIARHRGSFEHEAPGLGQQCELFGQRGGDCRRHVQAGRDLRSSSELGRAHGRPGQLLEVEGVSPALLVKESGAGHVEPLA